MINNNFKKHIPVLLEKAILSLNILPYGTYVDCTLGGAGHTSLICDNLTTGKIICIDRDPFACFEAKKILDANKTIIVNDKFSNLITICSPYKNNINGILMDLGTSSAQIDIPERGFSFIKDGPLDMRMNPNDSLTALQVLERFTIKQLSKLFSDFGSERYHLKLARIIKENIKNIKTTGELAELVVKSIGWHEKNQHPATRIFQALRIYVNDEINELIIGLQAAFSLLACNGRLSVISFHYLEDRCVKHFMTSKVRGDYHNPVSAKWIERVNKPESIEISSNKRARSAIFRCIEKTI